MGEMTILVGDVVACLGIILILQKVGEAWMQSKLWLVAFTLVVIIVFWIGRTQYYKKCVDALAKETALLNAHTTLETTAEYVRRTR